MNDMRTKLKPLAWIAVFGMAALLTGCPPVLPPPGNPGDYDDGFDLGFADDTEYWNGFYDSYDTVDGGPIYYAGSSIPYVENPPFDAGYYDGIWYAYNDGYFVDYDYAFTIGFSEGYDAAFGPGWPVLFDNDNHIEWLDGGFSDGYNDGFSEGRVFGAYDYENFIAFDWLDALLDYRDGTDLEIGGIGTGVFGPVFLYEYGTDPNDLVKSTDRARTPRAGGTPAIRNNGAKQSDVPPLSYRPLRSDVSTELNVRPSISPRTNTAVQLQTTWLERINAYRSNVKTNKHHTRAAAQ